jgi:hypothetical protein
MEQYKKYMQGGLNQGTPNNTAFQKWLMEQLSKGNQSNGGAIPNMPPERPPQVVQPGSQAASPRGPMDVAPNYNTDMSIMNNVAAKQGAVAPTQMKDQSRLAPNQMADKGPMPTPAPAPEDPWKRRLTNFAKAIDTPGRVVNGVYVSGPQAFRNNMGNTRPQETDNKTRKFLEEKIGKEATDAIMANGNYAQIQEEVSKAVQNTATTKFLGRDADNHRIVDWKDGKPVVTTEDGETRWGRLASGKDTAGPNLASQEAQQYKNDSGIAQAENVLRFLDRQDQENWLGDWSGTGSVLGYLKENYAPGSLEAQVAADVQSLAAQEIDQSLTAMRKASEDGSSGLGQITAKELDLLRDLRVSITTFQNKDELYRKVEELRARKQYTATLENIIRQANPQTKTDKLRVQMYLKENNLDSFNAYKSHHYESFDDDSDYKFEKIN